MTPPPSARGKRPAVSRPPSRGRKPERRGWGPIPIVGLLLVAAAVAWWVWPSRGPDVRRAANLAAPGDIVVFFGDSITQGYGVRSEESFPALAGQALGVPIVNAGVPGDTMSAGLARMERDVLPHRPRLAVVEFGENDFLRRVPVEETLQNHEGDPHQPGSQGGHDPSECEGAPPDRGSGDPGPRAAPAGGEPPAGPVRPATPIFPCPASR
jgi:GDSL-like Lipase/Acylhydrolase family